MELSIVNPLFIFRLNKLLRTQENVMYFVGSNFRRLLLKLHFLKYKKNQTILLVTIKFIKDSQRFDETLFKLLFFLSA